MMSPIHEYFGACDSGTLPAVTYLDPPFLPWWQADDHPLCDPAAGQRYLRDVFRAFVESPHWERGLFVLTYDEHGGFFDHVAPPVLPDLLASPVDADNFGQAGFRVPTILASPYAKPGFVDHRQYDHTSIMRFVEWRFLGAPPEGPGGSSDWSLTPRDRNANNIGASLAMTDPDPEVFDLANLGLRAPTADCDDSPQLTAPGMQPDRPTVTTMTAAEAQADPGVGGPGNDMLVALESDYFERVGVTFEPSPMAGIWAHPPRRPRACSASGSSPTAPTSSSTTLRTETASGLLRLRLVAYGSYFELHSPPHRDGLGPAPPQARRLRLLLRAPQPSAVQRPRAAPPQSRRPAAFAAASVAWR